MEDKKIDQILTNYADGLGHFNPPVKKPITVIWKPLAATAFGAAIVGAFVLMPRKASAAPMENVMTALNGAKYWRSDSWSKNLTPKETKWDHHSTTVYWNGELQFGSAFGKQMELTSTIKDGFEYDDFRSLPYILKNKIALKDMKFMSRFEDPLKNALGITRRNPEQLTRKNGLRYNGKEAYMLSLQLKGGNSTFEAIVDKETNLPLLVQTYLTGKNFRAQYKSEYRYDAPKNSVGIQVDKTKTVVDQEEERAAFQAKWSETKSSEDKPTLYSATVSPNGTIWVTYGVPQHEKNGWSPLKILGGNYTQSSGFLMNSYGGATTKFRVNGYEVAVSNYVPVDETKPTPTEISIEFGLKPAFLAMPKNMERKTVEVKLAQEKENFPNFFPAFMGEVPVQFLDQNFWSVRGHGKLAAGNLLGAAKAFEKSYDIMLTRYPTPYIQPLEAAAKCYDKLGMKDEARRVRVKAAENKNKRP